MLCSTVSFQESFLPTMPQDNLEEIVQAMGIGHGVEIGLFGYRPIDNTMLWGKASFLCLCL